MFGQSFPEDIDCGNFFDNMDDILDFPGCDMDVGFNIGDSGSFPNIWTNHQDTWPAASDPLFSSNTNSDSSPELYVPVSFYTNLISLVYIFVFPRFPI